MPRSKKRFLVCLTDEALAEIAETWIKPFIRWDRMLTCSTFIPDTPFCQLVALNPDLKYQDHQEFLVPYRYVNWVAVDEGGTGLGFGLSDVPKDSRKPP